MRFYTLSNLIRGPRLNTCGFRVNSKQGWNLKIFSLILGIIFLFSFVSAADNLQICREKDESFSQSSTLCAVERNASTGEIYIGRNKK